MDDKIRIIKICEYCGRNFSVFPSKEKQRFCCKPCHYAWSSENVRGENNPLYNKERNILICEYCRKKYEVDNGRKNISRFCSNQCHANWKHENIIGKNHPLYIEKISKICEYCGKEYLILPSSPQRFCCEKCASKWHSENYRGNEHWNYKTIIIICDNCGKSIERVPAGIRNHNFCGEKCYGEWRTKNLIGKNSPLWKGGISNSLYCYKFNEPLKITCRKYFNYLCFMDNEPESNGNALSVHHVSYDKRCGCNATQFCIFVPVKAKWNSKFNGSKEKNRWYWYSFLMNKIFIEHPNYFTYHIPIWGMSELEYNYSYVFEKFRRR